MNIQECLGYIQNEIHNKDTMLTNMENKNSQLRKTLATIRQQLERAIKNPSTLNDTVYSCVDLCRANLVFMDYSTGVFKQDPPLKDSEKTLS